MSEVPPLAHGESGESMQSSERFNNLVKLVRNEALIEGEPSMQFLDSRSLMESGGGIYYGTGLTTPRAISIGLPFDLLGMMLTAEKVRRAGEFDHVIHHIADTHAKSNEWIDHSAVEERAQITVDTLQKIQSSLGLTSFKFVLASEFDTTPSYDEILKEFNTSDEHEYVKREMADIEWYRRYDDVRIKMGWIIQAKQTDMGFDERRFDQEYLKFKPGQMSFIYTKPGRTFDTSRPKVSPYISIADEQRLLLSPGVDVKEEFEKVGDQNLGGARKHIQSIVRLYESIYGSLGKIGDNGITLESKVQAIIERCFA